MAPGTDGFQAPEIWNGGQRPCSTKTDAYSVGKTIANMMEAFLEDQRLCRASNNNTEEEEDHDDDEAQQRRLVILQDLCRPLTDSDPDQRWSLERALEVMQSHRNLCL